MSNRKKVIWAALLGSLLLNFFILFKMIQLQAAQKNALTQVNALTDTLHAANNKLNDLYEKIDSLNEKQKWVTKAQYHLIKVDKDLKTAKVSIHFTTRESEKGAKLFLLYRGKTGNPPSTWTQVPLDGQKGPDFTKVLNLPYREDYEIKIRLENNKIEKNESLLELPFLSELNRRMELLISPNSVLKGQADLFIRNHHKGQSPLKIKNMVLTTFINNKQDKKVVFFKDGRYVSNSQIKETKTENPQNSLKNSEEVYHYTLDITKGLEEKDLVQYVLTVEDFANIIYKAQNM
ncbi:MAG: hypothetical protein N2645_04110 [Clostridia bacterium]|nr:hypothetical protein [Clostridia bacterium]